MGGIENLLNTLKDHGVRETSQVENIIIDIIKKDREKLLKKLSEETAYRYDDIFDMVEVTLTD